MATGLDGLFDQYDRGRINRRQLLKGLAFAAAGGALAGDIGTADAAQSGGGLAPAMSISHVHVNVRSMQRSVEFYSSVLGARTKNTLSTLTTMSLPGAREGFGSWMSLDSGTAPRPTNDDAGGKPGIIGHVGYGITLPTSELPRIAEEIKQRFPDIKRPSLFTSAAAGQELYFFDPDGIALQLIQIQHDGQLSGYDPTPGENRFVTK